MPAPQVRNPSASELPDNGFIWMAHPSRNAGRPLPIWTYVDDGVRYYVPLDPADGTEFVWDERDDEWRIGPTLSSPSAGGELSDELHQRIMNLPQYELPDGVSPSYREGYSLGHRDARHAAAELVRSRLSASQGAAGRAMDVLRELVEAEAASTAALEAAPPPDETLAILDRLDAAWNRARSLLSSTAGTAQEDAGEGHPR